MSATHTHLQRTPLGVIMYSELHRTLLRLTNQVRKTKQLDQILTQVIIFGVHDSIPTWNSILRAYSRSSRPIKAILIYNHLVKSRNSVNPDNYTFPALLRACTCLHLLPKGREVHAHVTKVGLNCDVYVQNALVHFYGSTGQIDDARLVFDEMPERDLTSWNSLLGAYNCHSVLKIEALSLFREMISEGTGADAITLITILSSLAELRWPEENGSAIHCYAMKSGLLCKLNLQNALVGVYVKCRNMSSALALFNEMHGRIDLVTCTILINGYAEIGLMDSAREIFDQTVEKDAILWNSMIRGYVEAKLPEEAIALFKKMEGETVKPDETTIVSVVAACAALTDLQYGREVHSLILRNQIRLDLFVVASLIDMYFKCGSLEEAMVTFYKMVNKDVYIWTVTIAGLANYGYANEALKLFNQMESDGIEPNEATFVSILGTCRQSGLINEGCYLFKRMVGVYKIQPRVEHLGCLIDLLGKAGMVHEAEELAKAMPLRERVVAYKTLLSACISYSKVEVGLRVADELTEMSMVDKEIHVLVSNFYAVAQEWSKVAEMRKKMKKLGVVKEAGISSV